MDIKRERITIYPNIKTTEEESEFCKSLITLAEDFHKNGCPLTITEIVGTFVETISRHEAIDYKNYY